MQKTVLIHTNSTTRPSSDRGTSLSSSQGLQKDLLFTRKGWLLHEWEVPPHNGRCYFQKYVDEAAKKKAKDIFGGTASVPSPTSSGKRAPLDLDVEGVFFILILVLLVIAAAAAAAVALRAALLASSIGVEDLHGECLDRKSVV